MVRVSVKRRIDTHECLALTLVEVVASLLILGVSATAALVAQGQCMTALRTAHRQLQAEQIAAELIETWKLHGENIAIASDGVVNDVEGWSWRRASERQELPGASTTWAVTLTVMFGDPNTGAVWSRDYRWLAVQPTQEKEAARQ